MNLDDFKVGDQIVITSRRRQGTEAVEVDHHAEVICVDFKGNGMVTYSGSETGSGAFYPEKLPSAAKFGLCVRVKKVGHVPPWKPWTPKPGDVGFDLMC